MVVAFCDLLNVIISALDIRKQSVLSALSRRKGGETTKGKLFGAIMFLLAVIMLATPVMAIGPDKAEKNPNSVTTDATTGATVTELWLPSGVMNEFINTPFGPPGRAQVLDASKAKIGNAIIPGPNDDPFAFFDNENKWYYMTEENFVFLLGFMGLQAYHTYPDGLYIRIIYVAYKA